MTILSQNVLLLLLLFQSLKVNRLCYSGSLYQTVASYYSVPFKNLSGSKRLVIPDLDRCPSRFYSDTTSVCSPLRSQSRESDLSLNRDHMYESGPTRVEQIRFHVIQCWSPAVKIWLTFACSVIEALDGNKHSYCIDEHISTNNIWVKLWMESKEEPEQRPG